MIKKATNLPTERELLLNAVVQYTQGKEYKQAASRAFLAGARFYKEEIIKQ